MLKFMIEAEATELCKDEGPDSSSSDENDPVTLTSGKPDDYDSASGSSDDVLSSAASSVVYFSSKDASRAVNLPYMTSAYIWSDNVICDAQVQTEELPQIHKSCQTDLLNAVEKYADTFLRNLLVESFVTVLLPKRRHYGWVSTEELTEPLSEHIEVSYDSGIEEQSRSTSECTTLVRGVTMNHDSSTLRSICSDKLVGDGICEDKFSLEALSLQKKEYESGGEFSGSSNSGILCESKHFTSTPRAVSKEDEQDLSDENLKDEAASSLYSEVDSSCNKLHQIVDTGQFDLNNKLLNRPDVTDLSTIPVTYLTEKNNKRNVVSDPCTDIPQAILSENEFIDDNGNLDSRSSFDVVKNFSNDWMCENPAVLESDVDHLRRAEDEIIRSLQERCAPLLLDKKSDSDVSAVGKWLSNCSSQRNGQLSPVPEEAEEEEEDSSSPSPERFSSRDEIRTGQSSSRESSILGEMCSRTTTATGNSLDDADSVISSFGDEKQNGHKELKEGLLVCCQQPDTEVWTPGSQPPVQPVSQDHDSQIPGDEKDVNGGPLVSSACTSENKENMSPIWQPFGGGSDDKPKFRSVQPSSPVTHRKEPGLPVSTSKPLVTSDNSAPTSPREDNGVPLEGSSRIGVSSGLLQYQNPTITLLQKAREGQLPKGALYIDQTSKDDVPPGAVQIDQRVTVDGDQVHTDTFYALPKQEMVPTGHTRVIKAPPKIEGIGPTERGIPVTLRTGVKEEYASDWYKSMFKSLHKADKPENDYISVKYGKKGGISHTGGYMSEPELDREDDRQTSTRAYMDVRRRPQQQTTYAGYRPSHNDDVSTFQPSHICADVYQNQPRSIAEYQPGMSSIVERDARREEESGENDQNTSKYLPPIEMPRFSYIDGYESDSTLIRKTGNRLHPLDPVEQKAWYREVQRGGDIPFSGLGKPPPDRPKPPTVGPPPPPSEDDILTSMSRDPVSPHRYQEGEVNIHFRTPVRNLEKDFVEEETLRKRQEEQMRKFYEEERYKKQLQHLQEIEMRRHNDFFTPSQKSPIPLNRYDNPFEQPLSPPPRNPEPKIVARALFNFQAQSLRELSLKKGDIVIITKKIDRNWYEGERLGLQGMFPSNYVEIIPGESAILQPRKSTEGQARAKYNFRAQTPIELSLFKGELVTLTRRVDRNWYEGRMGNKKGIFPAAYVDVLSEPVDQGLAHPKRSPKLNGTHPTRNPYRAREAFSSYPATSLSTSRSSTTSMSSQEDKKQPITETLHVDTYSEPIPYKALYSYNTQNEDELELKEGDTVYVMEKCDDGWYVGTSLRTGLFGTFPGNYVERI